MQSSLGFVFRASVGVRFVQMVYVRGSAEKFRFSWHFHKEQSMADEADMANEILEQNLALALAQRASAHQEHPEPPDEDNQGNRYCLDCGEIIPPERVQLVQAVRCVHCAGKRERRQKHQSGGFGMTRFPSQSQEPEE